MIQIIQESENNSALIAAKHLKKGGIVAFATDTVYGFGVSASDSVAVDRLYELKKRDSKKAVAVLLRSFDRAQELLCFNEASIKISKKFLPGPLTIILPIKGDNKKLSKNLNLMDSSIGFRVVDQDFINRLFSEFDGDIALSSANVSQESVFKSGREIYESFYETKLDLLVVDSGELNDNLASTIVKVDNDKLEILREGIISKETINNETS